LQQQFITVSGQATSLSLKRSALESGWEVPDDWHRLRLDPNMLQLMVQMQPLAVNVLSVCYLCAF
jgi:hypothetical protein